MWHECVYRGLRLVNTALGLHDGRPCCSLCQYIWLVLPLMMNILHACMGGVNRTICRVFFFVVES